MNQEKKDDDLMKKNKDLLREFPLERVSQKPANASSDSVEWLQGGDFPVFSGKEFPAGMMGYDTPHLSKHDRIETFMVVVLPEILQDDFRRLFGQKFPHYAGEGKGTVFFQGHTRSENVFYNRLSQLDDIRLFPDILITSDVNNLYHHAPGLICEDHFESFRCAFNPAFSGSGIEHPQKLFRYLAADTMVIVADRNRYLDRPEPAEWYELLSPSLENQIVFCGDVDYHCNTVFVNFVKNFGYQAVKQLSRNIAYRIHPMEMLESIVAKNKLHASLYVMPYSYARYIRNKLDYRIIWPDDGAIVLPVQMLVKKGVVDKYRDIIRFFTGADAGRLFAGNGFIPVNINSGSPEETGKLNWLGWDFISEVDMEEIKREIGKILQLK